MIIGCPKHGWSKIEPRHHYKGTGCYKCGRERFSKKVSKYTNLENVIKDFKSVHGDTYSYEKVKLTKEDTLNTMDRVKIVCKKHGEFNQQVATHLKGSGCSKCRYFGYTRSSFVDHCKDYGKEEAYLYLIEFRDEEEIFYKVGITTLSVKERFRKKKSKAGYKIKTIILKSLPPVDAWNKERYIKSKYAKYSYDPKRFFPGATECFTTDLPIDEIKDSLK